MASNVPVERGGVAGPTSQGLGSFLRILIPVEVFSGLVQAYFYPIYAELAGKFHVSIGTLSWSLTAFTLATCVLTPVLTKLGDVYGHRLILRIVVAAVTLGSVLVAAAPNFGVLVAGRFLQGAVYAYLPLMFGLVRSRYSHDDTRRAVSYLSSVLVFGILVGTMLVGVIVRYSSGPSWALWLPVVGGVAALLGLLIVRGERVERSGQRVDWAGAALLGGGLLLLLLALSEGSAWNWSSPTTVGCLCGGVFLLLVWAWVERVVAEPLVDLRFLFRPALLPVYLVGFCIYFGSVGSGVTSSTFLAAPDKLLSYGGGLSAFGISMLSPLTLGAACLTVLFTARMGRAVGFRSVMAAGAILATLGYASMALWHSSLTAYLVAFFIATGGLGFIEGSTRTVIVDDMRQGEVATGEGVYELSISLGGAVGSAVIGAVMSAHASVIPGIAAERGYVITWTVVAVVCLAASILAVGYVIAGRRSRPVPAEELALETL
jgi:predicted MFS family arabinose efflux permease